MKILKRILLPFLIIGTFCVLSLAALLHSQAGLDLTLKIAKNTLPGHITYESATGTHSSIISFTNLHYSNDKLDAHIKNLNIKWEPLDLFIGKLKIENLIIDEPKIIAKIKNTKNEKTNFSIHDIKPPINITLENLSINKLNFSTDDELIQIEGNIKNNLDISWKINDQFIDANGQITGELLHPTISAEFKSKTLNYKKISLTDFSLKTMINLDILDRKTTIEKFQFSSKETNEWKLNAPTSITHHNKFYQFSAFCLDNSENHFCANGKWHKNNNFEIYFAGNNIPIDWLGPTIHSDLIINGKLDLKGNILGNTQTTPSGKVELKLHPGNISYPIDMQTKTFAYKGGKFTANLSSKGLQGDLDIRFIENSQLKAHLNIPEFYWLEPFGSEQEIDAGISWHFPSIQFFQPLIPSISDLDGALHINYYLSGSLANPKLTGNATVDEISFRVPKLRTTYTNVQGDAIANGKQINYTLSAKADGGDLLISGQTKLNKNFPSQFTIKGNSALISDNNGIKLYASPDVNIEILDNTINLEGRIHIPSALIQINDYSDSVALPSEVVYINEGKKNNEPKWEVYSSIDLSLGKDIKIEGMGINATLGGELKITDSPEKTTVAYGNLHVVEGKYKFYSTDLEITKGNLIFTGGPIYNPAVNVSAVRHFSGTQTTSIAAPALTVGLNVTGTLNKPEISLFSTPERYNQSDILSFLLLGQPLEQAGTDNANILLSAASAIDIGGDGKLSNVRNQIKNTLGLTELDITSETEYLKKTNKTIQHTALVLGKYLSPKLYVKYSFDVLDHSNKVQLRYWLNKNWSIQTESRGPESSGVDILYSIERK